MRFEIGDMIMTILQPSWPLDGLLSVSQRICFLVLLDWSKAASPFMPWLVVTGPHFIAGQTLVISFMRPLANKTEVTARVFAVAVKVILLYTLKVLRR